MSKLARPRGRVKRGLLTPYEWAPISAALLAGRALLRMSQGDISKAIGCTRTTLHSVETNPRRANAAVAHAGLEVLMERGVRIELSEDFVRLEFCTSMQREIDFDKGETE